DGGMMNKSYDLVILGSGSTAFAAAIRAGELGKSAVMTEVRTVGGTCVNRGCLPSKNLIEAAKILHDARNPRYPGMMPCEMQIDFAELIAGKDEVIHLYRDKKYNSIVDESGDIEIVHGRARLAGAHTVEVAGPEGVEHLEGSQILIALGSSPVTPAIEGLQDVPYITSDLLTSQEDLELKELPRSLIIVGGGYIGLELGQMFQRFGAEVTLLERNAHILFRGYEPEIGLTLQPLLEEEGLAIETDAQVVRVRREGNGVVVTARVGPGRAAREREFRADKLLIATGRKPNTENIGLEQAGVRTNGRGEIAVDEHLRTNVPHIWAAGDIIGVQTGSQMATPVGARDGGIVAENAFSPPGEPLRRVDHRVIPRTIFTDPQVGVVGMTEEEALAAGHPCWCNTVPMELVPRAGSIRDTRGAIKMVADADTGEVLGVSMVGVNAGEVIHEAAMALRFRATIDDYIDLLHVYPTMAEALKIVAISRYKDPAKLSCCAE
ncbi:MAG TPA: mercury(II) reductase, partial [Herpetosiphonaceae bacterium]|nr:mercury(II) reductase [Herpetosiphonaceae bacterium]